MKVLAGEFRSRTLRTARGNALRPTAAAVRETLFNLIGDDVRGGAFLDLCAGSGSVGIEALSRGAPSAVFVDRHPTAIALVHRNLAALGLEDRGTVLRRDAVRAAAELARRGLLFGTAFIDPPYDSDAALRSLRSPRWRAIMRARSRIYVEHRRDLSWPSLEGWEIADRRRFGETVLTVFRGVDEE